MFSKAEISASGFPSHEKKKKSLKESEKMQVMGLYVRLRINDCKINYANIL